MLGKHEQTPPVDQMSLSMKPLAYLLTGGEQYNSHATDLPSIELVEMCFRTRFFSVGYTSLFKAIVGHYFPHLILTLVLSSSIVEEQKGSSMAP